jgi:hypothetical protein
VGSLTLNWSRADGVSLVIDEGATAVMRMGAKKKKKKRHWSLVRKIQRYGATTSCSDTNAKLTLFI